MNVYFVPLPAGRFEPYFEQDDEPDEADGAAPPGFFARMRARFRAMVRDAEEQRHERLHEPPTTALGRLQRTLLGWVAERVVEQRLLWHLRSASEAVLHVPDTLKDADALTLLRHGLQRDADRHLVRMLLHGLGLLASLPFVLFPGPNIFGYFFTFTVVGHLLAYRGAKRGLHGVRWSVTPSAALTTIGRAVVTPPPERYALIHEASEHLRLARLSRFVERMVAPPA